MCDPHGPMDSFLDDSCIVHDYDGWTLLDNGHWTTSFINVSYKLSLWVIWQSEILAVQTQLSINCLSCTSFAIRWPLGRPVIADDDKQCMHCSGTAVSADAYSYHYPSHWQLALFSWISIEFLQERLSAGDLLLLIVCSRTAVPAEAYTYYYPKHWFCCRQLATCALCNRHTGGPNVKGNVWTVELISILTIPPIYSAINNLQLMFNHPASDFKLCLKERKVIWLSDDITNISFLAVVYLTVHYSWLQINLHFGSLFGSVQEISFLVKHSSSVTFLCHFR